MAEIDKSLPNEVRTEVKVPGEEEIAQEVNVEEILHRAKEMINMLELIRVHRFLSQV